MRVAAIDVGTNSVHLLVADVGPGGEATVVEKARVQVELGRGGIDRHVLTPAAMQRGVDALKQFKQAMDGLQVDACTASATSAVREAKNGDVFRDAVRDATDIHIRTISGLEEARLIHLGILSDLDFSRGYPLLFDIGGGSCELILCDAHQILACHSVPLGHIRMKEAYLGGSSPTREQLQEIRDATKRALRRVLTDIQPGLAGTFIGTSGSIRTLAKMATMANGAPEPQHSHGLVLTRSQLRDLLTQFTTHKASRLSDLPGMDMRRKATLPAAAAVLYQTMKTLDHDTIVTSERSLRDGLIADWAHQNQPELELQERVAWPRMRAVLRLFDRFGSNRPHTDHVRDLALELFDGLAETLDLDSNARRMLEFAALLHDIGHHIDGRDHNKHGQYLILNSRLTGFTAPEVNVLASVVRHHRGSKPKPTQEHMLALSRADQRQIVVLSTLLRFADALDRSHNQSVRQITVNVTPEHVDIIGVCGAEVHMERWAAERRKAMIESLVDRPVRVVLDHPDASAHRPVG